jgi:hypothetical protein
MLSVSAAKHVLADNVLLLIQINVVLHKYRYVIRIFLDNVVGITHNVLLQVVLSTEVSVQLVANACQVFAMEYTVVKIKNVVPVQIVELVIFLVKAGYVFRERAQQLITVQREHVV